MVNNVIKFVPPPRASQEKTIVPARKSKLLGLYLTALFKAVGEGLLFSGMIVVALSLMYVLISFYLEESPFNSELPYVGLGFLWGFFSVTLNDGLRKK